MINNKTHVSVRADVETNEKQEMALAMFLRMKGRLYRHSEMAVTLSNAVRKAASDVCPQLVEVLLAADDDAGTMRVKFIKCLRDRRKRVGKHAKTKFDPVIHYLEVI